MGSLTFDFSNKTVLITGAGQGIGRKLTEDFLSSGARVIAWDYNEKALIDLEKSLKSKQLFCQKVDVSSWDDCKKQASALEPSLDILINNAGILRDRSFSKMSKEEYDSVINTNLNSVFYVTKQLLPKFNPTSTAKRIVSLSSLVALYGNFGQSNYVAAKSGVIGLTRVWARELAKKHFTVNAIAPGFIKTSILKEMSQEILDSLIKKIPVGRIGTTEDVSKACLFLCSDEACYINGIVLSIDGGATI